MSSSDHTSTIYNQHCATKAQFSYCFCLHPGGKINFRRLLSFQVKNLSTLSLLASILASIIKQILFVSNHHLGLSELLLRCGGYSVSRQCSCMAVINLKYASLRSSFTSVKLLLTWTSRRSEGYTYPTPTIHTHHYRKTHPKAGRRPNPTTLPSTKKSTAPYATPHPPPHASQPPIPPKRLRHSRSTGQINLTKNSKPRSKGLGRSWQSVLCIVHLQVRTSGCHEFCGRFIWKRAWRLRFCDVVVCGVVDSGTGYVLQSSCARCVLTPSHTYFHLAKPDHIPSGSTYPFSLVHLLALVLLSSLVLLLSLVFLTPARTPKPRSYSYPHSFILHIPLPPRSLSHIDALPTSPIPIPPTIPAHHHPSPPQKPPTTSHPPTTKPKPPPHTTPKINHPPTPTKETPSKTEKGWKSRVQTSRPTRRVPSGRFFIHFWNF